MWEELPEERRELLLAYDAEVCPNCGNLRSVCSDPSIDWHPHTSTCWAGATRDWGVRRFQEKHKDEPFEPTKIHSTEGVSIWVSQTPPEVDEFA